MSLKKAVGVSMGTEESIVDGQARSAGDVSSQSLVHLIEQYRPYLLAIAIQEVPPQLCGKVGASDLVQDAIVRGVEQIGSFRGTNTQQLACWLRQILLNHVRNVAKSYCAEKRDVGREQCVEGHSIAEHRLSASRELMARERAEQMQAALLQLPAELRQLIELRHRDDLPFAEIARRLGLSEAAARRGWAKGIRQLQLALKKHDSV